MVSFSPLDPGTAEGEWARAFSRRELPSASLDLDGVVVVAAHPDDESLGAAGLIHLAARRGIPVRLLVVTDGERSHPASPTHSPGALARRRGREALAAARILCPDAAVRRLGLPDGGLDDAGEALDAAVRAEIAAVAPGPRRVLVAAPWEGDGHRDHRLVAVAARRAAEAAGAVFRGYPVWLWHWGGEDDAPWAAMEAVPLDAAALAAKRRAIRAHASQVAPLSDAAGDEPVLHAAMLEHFLRPFEVLVRPEPAPGSRTASPPRSGSIPSSHFDAYFSTHQDPWGFESRWYERRKRELLLAALPRPRYAAALELGCATGVLTARLAERCDRVLAVDFSREALATARRALAGDPAVELRSAQLPREWPSGAFDLVVFSEIGYFWDVRDLQTAISRMRRCLRSGGHLVACHWRHPVPENPVTGDGVHVALRTDPRLTTLVLHEEEDFLLEVFAAGRASSVARETGIVT